MSVLFALVVSVSCGAFGQVMPRKFSNSLFSDGRMDCEIDFLIHRRFALS